MEREQRGRGSRASSTSSLGREVRCGCQYYQSDSLLPERRALLGRPPSRTMQQPPAVRCSEHEYEPIAAPSPSPSPKAASAPVVRITDTDVVPVADSDESIDDRARLPPELTRAGELILPLDGKIEDTAMEARELVETGDTSEELETPQQLQERLEERFFNAATPGAESRTDGEVNTSQVDSLALEELPLRRGARGLPHKLKTQAGKLRTRLKNIKRPTFALPERQRAEKTRSTSSGRSDKSRTEKRPSRMDRIRSSFSERPRFSLPDRSKFHLPERPKFNLKNALARTRRSPPPNERSTDPTVGSRGRNIFDFSTYPRIFDRKSKNKADYATSTPKDSRAQSAESATFPRPRKGMVVSKRWTRRFENTTAYIDEDRSGADTAAERSPPWRHPSREEPRLSLGFEGDTRIPWEEKERPEELQYMDYEQESPEISERHAHPTSEASRTEDDSYDREQIPESNARLYQDQDAAEAYLKGTKKEEEVEEGEVDWRAEERIARDEIRAVQRSRSLEAVLRAREEEGYDGTFVMVDPRRYGVHKTPSEEEEEEYDEEMEEEEEEEEEEEAEPSSAQSDREQQQSSGSSCDRRRRGVIEEIDYDEFFLSQDDTHLGKYLTTEIRDALRAEQSHILVGDASMPAPPQRPTRSRSLGKKQKEGSIESYEAMPPARPKRDPNRSRRSESIEEQFPERTRSDSKHRIVYQTEGEPPELPIEPLDDIVVVKPVRRKSKSSQRSRSQIRTDTPRPPSPASVPPVVPTRRKRLRKETPTSERRNGELAAICNGHTEWAATDSAPEKPLPLPPTDQLPDDQEAYTAEEIIATSEENIRMLATRLREEEYMEPAPVPPKRRSRSRGTSVAQDEDRTSHGAESLPEIGYVEEDIPRDDLDFGRDLSGYAIIEKRDKPPRPPPPRRKKDKFATTPRPVAPKRPQRAYSTLVGPSMSREMNILTDEFETTTLQPAESAPYIEIDSDDGEHKDLRSDEVLSKMQGRPLPAPPRPPRVRKDRSLERSAGAVNQESIAETTTATQTDPLPDDMVIEEEVTQAKLVVAPSVSGSQIMVSTERIPSPSNVSTPPVPPLSIISQRMRREEETELPYDTVSLKSPSPAREMENLQDRHLSAPHLGERIREENPRVPSVHSALSSNEPVRISNLEVGDLRVDRLNVSQIEAGKIVASEVDTLVITASELKSMTGMLAEGLSPSIIKELIAIRSHLETVAASQAQQSQVRQGRPIEEETERKPGAEQTVQESPLDAEKSRPTEEQKVVKREVVETKDKEMSGTRTQSIARANVEDNEIPVTHTLSVTQVEFSDKDIFLTTQSPSVVQPTEDTSLRIFDSESLLSLSTATAKQPNVDESRASLPPSRTTKTDDDAMQSRFSSDRMFEPSDEQLEGSTDSKIPAEFSTLMTEHRDEDNKESSPERSERKSRKSRSRSPSPIRVSPARQTASPVRSLPPAISVTPDTPDNIARHGITSETQPQRAVISYTSYTEVSERESQRETSQSPIVPSFPLTGTHLIAFPASQIPSQFYSLTSQPVDSEATVSDSARQLIRVLRLACIKAMRHFVRYTASMVGEESREKIREVELTICAILLLVTGLLIFLFSSTRTVTHHHHWDYFNPPK
ncbi:proteoglycan 4 [Osmia bicornis bicornis]|uniref:proteoglycan 4 n=1 Tax=Osmia bicornis bicornis TaxID=1437191 RepID=UPI001EAEED58|nr:proteoglycan 4 [Osmia bicornis bicornis]